MSYLKSLLRTRLKSVLETTEIVEAIPVKSIVPSRFPLRSDLGDISSLASSIGKSGLLEPIIVRPLDTKFEIVAGHRRFEACRKNRFHEIPAIVKELTDKEAYAVSLEENLQRQTLDPLEEAASFKFYTEKYGYGSVSELAQRLGKSEELVSHRIMLLSLPADVREQVRRRLLGPSDAWEISRVKVPELQKEIAKTAIFNGTTVRGIRKVANLVKAGTSVNGAFEMTDFERNQSASGGQKYRDTARLRSTAITSMKVALIRLDNLIGRASRDSKAMKELVGLRLGVHDLIGRFQVGRVSDASPSEDVASLVKDRFLEYFNSGRIKEIARMRSRDKFTIFDDYPLPLMNLKESLKHDSGVLRSSLSRNCVVEDLKVHVFGNGTGAIATFLFLQRHTKRGRVYSWRSRVSFVFERSNGEWQIVHEHWSEANRAQTTIRRLKKVNEPAPRQRPSAP
jgi:ParB family chromosome partitioning protein